MNYEDLKLLDELRQKGSITEEEYQREKDKILNKNNFSTNRALFGLEENTYLMLMHLSQFLGFLFVGLGFLAPIIMWLTNKDNNTKVDSHGKNILNFIISMVIYYIASGILCILLIGIPLLIMLGILNFVFIIIAAIKGGNGEYWKYPFSIEFVK